MLEGGGVEVRAAAEAMAAARKWNVLSSSVGSVEVGAGAERKGGRRELVGRGWKLVGWRRKVRSFVCKVGGGGETGAEGAVMAGEVKGRSSKSSGPLVRRRGTSTTRPCLN